MELVTPVLLTKLSCTLIKILEAEVINHLRQNIDLRRHEIIGDKEMLMEISILFISVKMLMLTDH